MKRILPLLISLAIAAPVLAAGKAATAPVIVIKTSLGTMKAELYPDKAPITVKNILQYVDDKFYDGTIFHRVIPGFMIQGGGFDKDMAKKPTRASIKNESFNGLKNERGTLAMARTPDPDSGSSQFFVNTVNNAFLDKANSQDGFGYCVFGKVTEGLDVLDKIKAVPTGVKDGMRDVPTTPVVIESIRRDQ